MLREMQITIFLVMFITLHPLLLIQSGQSAEAYTSCRARSRANLINKMNCYVPAVETTWSSISTSHVKRVQEL